MSDPICTIGLVAFDSNPSTLFSSFAARYKTDEAGLSILGGVEVVQASVIVPSDLYEKVKIELSVTSHVDCECAPVRKKIFYAGSADAIANFFIKLTEKGCFVWIVSMPSYEIRVLVDAKTHRVVTKKVNQRTLQ